MSFHQKLGKKYLLVTASLLISIISTSQIVDFKGKIIDRISGEPLQFVNIQLKNSGIGSISGENGYFRLKIPANHIHDIVLISCLGYENQEIPISSINRNIVIELKPIDYRIGEVIIMPDTTLLSLLEKAFKKIPVNYPNYPTKLKGFYRETIKTTKNNYLYFAEAVTETYKSSYEISSDNGQVKIIKSIINEFPDIDSLKLRFYGGIYKANEGDLVKKKVDFINPKSFNKYIYSLQGTSEISGNEVYIIGFDTKNDSLKGTKKGKFYIEKGSLAYIDFEYEATQRGIDNFNENLIRHSSTKQFKKKVHYIKFNNRWHLKYIQTNEIFSAQNSKSDFKLDAEYIANEIYTDSVKPIPLSERLEFSDIFSEEAKNYYSDDYWGEYNVLQKDSLLDYQIKLLYDTVESKQLLTQKTQYTKKNNLIKVLSKLSFGYGLSYYPTHAEKGIYDINYTNNNNTISLSEELNPFQYTINLFAQFNYYLNYRWLLNFSINTSLGDKIDMNIYDFGASYRILIKKRSNPLFLNLSLLFSYDNFYRNFSIYQNNVEFEFANKTFDAEKLSFEIGFKELALKPKLSLEYNVKRRLYLHLAAAYFLPFSISERLYLKEKSGFFLIRKSASLPLTDNSISVRFNGEPTTKSHINFDNYSFDLGLMLKF